ncbi:cyclic nucleotide-binding domain-containing protein [Desulfotomaculum sp. 1211_IL3151]|uniref:cyclic nucleotide-binding domain-containing protein n=1 Tax=Desulfotomaculum sp. 1211_IL3151 TaxID=3084055 RepID=UPI002FD9E816
MAWQTPEDLIYKTLHDLNLFKGIPSEHLHAISKDCTLKTLRVQDPIIYQLEVLRNFFIVSSGELEVYTTDENGEKVILDRLLSGDYYGDICLLTGEPSPVNISAVRKSQVIIFDDNAFQRLIHLLPNLSNRIIKTLSSQLQKVNLENTAAKDKQLALATFMLESRSYLNRLVGQSKFSKVLRHKMDDLAKHSEPLLLTGEKGTGKLLIANLIHRQSKRKELPFIVVDCEELSQDEEGNKLLGPLSKTSTPLDQFSYLDLAQRGTLYLNDIELLPRGALLRLLEYVNRSREVRIIMASLLNNPSQYIEKRFPGVTCYPLFRNGLYLEPLRNRKKDIPELLKHFVELKCTKHNKEIMELAPDAVEKLLSHDYQQSNIQELEEIIDRAVILTEGKVIEADSIILGEVTRSLTGYNLLNWQFFKELIQQQKWPQRAQLLVTIIFLSILLFSYIGGNDNPFISLLTWKVMGPAIIIACLVLARTACSICPFSQLASIAQHLKCFEKHFPAFLTRYYYITIGFLFSLILWYEEYFVIKDSTYLTSLLLIAISLAAITCGLLFKGHVWCRYMCPLGAIFAVSSTLSVVELRTKTDICQNQCMSFNCYKGNSRSGCPMLLHAMYIDSNINCKLCFKCVTNCPNDSIKFSLRPPGREIFMLSNVHGGFAVLVIFFAFMLIPPLTMESIKAHYPFQWKLLFNLFYWLLFTLLLVIVVAYVKKHLSSKYFTPYLRLSLGFTPLIAAANISYQLGSKFDELKVISLQLVYGIGKQQLFTTNACSFLQTFLMLFGLLWTLYCLFRILPQIRHKGVTITAVASALGYFALLMYFL